MYLVSLKQEDISINLGLFNAEKNARDFIEQLPHINSDNWTIDPNQLNTLHKMHYKHNEIILSNTMFYQQPLIDVDLNFIPNLDDITETYSHGETVINHYAIPNHELEQFITLRQQKINFAIASLKQLGYDSQINGKGSQDGEYISYTSNSTHWHFLTHIDDDFIFTSPDNHNDFISYIKELLI